MLGTVFNTNILSVNFHYTSFYSCMSMHLNDLSQSLFQVMYNNLGISKMLTQVWLCERSFLYLRTWMFVKLKGGGPEVRAGWSDALGWLIIENPAQNYSDICAMFWNVKNYLWDSFFWLHLVRWYKLPYLILVSVGPRVLLLILLFSLI